MGRRGPHNPDAKPLSVDASVLASQGAYRRIFEGGPSNKGGTTASAEALREVGWVKIRVPVEARRLQGTQLPFRAPINRRPLSWVSSQSPHNQIVPGGTVGEGPHPGV